MGRAWQVGIVAVEHADGPSLRCAGLPRAVEVAAVLGPREGPDRLHQSWLNSTREVHLATAPMFGAISVPARAGPALLLEAGRSWQRVQLEATVHGLALQPPRPGARGPRPRAPAEGRVAPRDGWVPALMFRLGYPLRPAVPSARRPLAEVLDG